jgi:hypothetical protein
MPIETDREGNHKMTAQDAAKLSTKKLQKISGDPHQPLGARFAAGRELDLRALGYQKGREV